MLKKCYSWHLLTIVRKTYSLMTVAVGLGAFIKMSCSWGEGIRNLQPTGSVQEVSITGKLPRGEKHELRGSLARGLRILTEVQPGLVGACEWSSTTLCTSKILAQFDWYKNWEGEAQRYLINRKERGCPTCWETEFFGAQRMKLFPHW